MKIYHQSVFERWDIGDGSVQALITSPPYYSLRKYSIPDVIIGGDKDCKHEWGKINFIEQRRSMTGVVSMKAKIGRGFSSSSSSCIKCNAFKGQHGLEPSFKLYLAHCKLWMQEAIRVVNDDGVIFVNFGDSYSGSNCGSNDYTSLNRCKPESYQEMYKGQKTGKQDVKPKSKLLLPERFAIMCVDELGLILRNHIVWYKPNGMPESCTDRFSKKWESIFMLTKPTNTQCWKHNETSQWVWEKPEPDYYFVDGKRRNHWQGFDYYFNLDDVRETHAEATRQRVKYPTGMSQEYKNNDMGQPKGTFEHILERGKNPSDVWAIPTQPSPERHFAMWPEKLVERMILCSTKVGDVVLDPFCGSGTTLRVADRLNRIGIGLDLGYREIQEKRLSEIQKELVLA